MRDYDFCFIENGEYFGKIKDSEEKITKKEFEKWIRKTIIDKLKLKEDEIPV